jgi:hypothetical protein
VGSNTRNAELLGGFGAEGEAVARSGAVEAQQAVLRLEGAVE